jgi:chemotaxis protein methyltransferase CheR
MSVGELRRLIETELGIMMPPAKEPLLHSRLQRRLRDLGLDSLAAYLAHLRTDPTGELRELVSAVTTNTTDFFREAVVLDALVEQLVPPLLAADPYRVVKVWSAGCSSGEEPYSIAMALSDLQRRQPGWDFAILATDVSPTVLAQARRAVYDLDRTTPIPAPLAQRFLMPSRDPATPVVRVRPELRAKVTFAELNFMDEAYAIADTFDVIFFRNVAIYFDRATQEAVVAKLCRYLHPGGHLILGQTESLIGRDVPVVHLGRAIYQRRGAAT